MDNIPQNQSNSEAGGGLSVIQYWVEKTLSPQGLKLWQTLNHKSAGLSCAWGTGGQKEALSMKRENIYNAVLKV